MEMKEMAEFLKTARSDIRDFIENHGYTENINKRYQSACLKNDYKPIGELANIINQCKQNYGAHDLMIFGSSGYKPFTDFHEDAQDVLIFCLVGVVSYKFENDNSVTFNPDETLFIPRHIKHGPFSNGNRFVLSMATNRILDCSEPTYHYNNINCI